MSSERLIAGGIMALGLAVLGGFALSQTAIAQDVTDGPGPNLVIEVAGSTSGTIVIDMAQDAAPGHVAQITALAQEGAYDGVVFHRVIEGFMAQTGDVEFGRQGGDLSMAGMGGSSKPDLAAEFSALSFDRGVVGMARSMDPNSANSQFFIMFAPAPHLDGQYTVVGKVISGMEVVDAIKKGDPAANGAVDAPDYMAKVTLQE
ncbi:peptidylprolyl isomerase [Tabrizicola sp. M-4]|uniref:peptidylprolyl isomerase n=1 Tax=Tabrizicola sp. M-4 TaxID=3055847 RepID=UPI003DA9F898